MGNLFPAKQALQHAIRRVSLAVRLEADPLYDYHEKGNIRETLRCGAGRNAYRI